MHSKKRALITGITGQDGAYLAAFLLSKEYEVFGLVSRRVNQSFSNLEYLGISDRVNFIFGDLLDQSSLGHALKTTMPHEIYNLAAMSFVGLSWQEPILTTQTNALGPLYLLEAIKLHCPNSRVYQASTSEMFGNSMEVDQTQNENTPMKPRSPYGFAKLFAHNAIVNYRESFSIFCCSGILFNHESPIRGEEFVTRKITKTVAKISQRKADFVELGNLDSRRDWGFAGDYVEAMWLMLQNDKPTDYVVATGKTWSIADLLSIAFLEIGIKDWGPYVKQNPSFLRPAELFYLKGDCSKARRELNWQPRITFQEMIKNMVQEDLKRV